MRKAGLSLGLSLLSNERSRALSGIVTAEYHERSRALSGIVTAEYIMREAGLSLGLT